MKSFAWRRTAAISRKEIFHILRDPFTLGFALALPAFMVAVFGVAIEFNVQEIPLSVSDSDRTESSRMLIDTFASSHYFVARPAASPDAAAAGGAEERSRAALVIPPGFERDLFEGRGGEAQILVDGSDNSTVGPVLGYLGSIQTMASRRIAGFAPRSPYELRTRFLFNPELNSRWFAIPGLAVVILAMISTLLTALTVAREWENGSMELLLSTPVRPSEIIVGKVAPYGILGLLGTGFVYAIARAVFGIPFAGSLLVFGLGSLLFLLTYLALGIFISVTTRQQVIAMQFSMITSMLPNNLLSGFIFPIESMPVFFQYLTMLLPARWFMKITRDSFLKGSGFLDLSGAFLALSVFCVATILLSVKSFKRDLEP